MLRVMNMATNLMAVVVIHLVALAGVKHAVASRRSVVHWVATGALAVVAEACSVAMGARHFRRARL